MVSVRTIAERANVIGKNDGGRTALSDNHARTLFINKLIPDDWKKFELIFAGSQYKDRDNVLYLPYARWNGASDFYTDFLPYTDLIGEVFRVVMAVESQE